MIRLLPKMGQPWAGEEKEALRDAVEQETSASTTQPTGALQASATPGAHLPLPGVIRILATNGLTVLREGLAGLLQVEKAE